MKYHPDTHHRRSIRLKGYDYSHEGAYFVTICTFNRDCIFEEFPRLKRIVEKHWEIIPRQHENVILDEYIIMPNHLHGIIVIMATDENRAGTRFEGRGKPSPYVGAPLAGALPSACPLSHASPSKPIGDIIGAFKSLSSIEWLRIIKAENINARGKFWQRNYYEHIIRNDDELNRIREYIMNNPAQWAEDENNPENVKQHIKTKYIMSVNK